MSRTGTRHFFEGLLRRATSKKVTAEDQQTIRLATHSTNETTPIDWNLYDLRTVISQVGSRRSNPTTDEPAKEAASGRHRQRDKAEPDSSRTN